MMKMKVLSGIFFTVLMLFLLPAYTLAEPDMPFHDLIVQLDPEGSALTGVSTISLPPGKTARINLSGIKVRGILLHNRPLAVDPGTESLTFTPGSSADVLKIEFEAAYPALPASGKGKEPAKIEGNNHVSHQGILLMENWHPVVEGNSLYRLTAVMPSGFEAVSETEEVQIRERSDKKRDFLFNFKRPLRSLTLIAGKYHVEKETRGEVDIYTYFFPEGRGLSQTYRGYAGMHLDRYEKYLGKYPFKRFSVVENFLPASYGLTTFCLLGKDVVKTPVNADAFLGHEILRQWFGKSCLYR